MKKLPRLWLAGMLCIGLIAGLVLGGMFFSRTEYVKQGSDCPGGCYLSEKIRNNAVLTGYTQFTETKTVNSPYYPSLDSSCVDCLDLAGSSYYHCFLSSVRVDYNANTGTYQITRNCACWK